MNENIHKQQTTAAGKSALIFFTTKGTKSTKRHIEKEWYGAERWNAFGIQGTGRQVSLETYGFQAAYLPVPAR